ncbi:variable surface protein [Plasmodium gonderi]|uniref:Variable surface protein n=1 Tax=Plasmodium gonderi TaxID=77519 RepID=A0A1Y1JSY9_PLAGO|nr:variable surface protein [Plasmodium gonderi]GAW83902.1 variable surface protein [Plasmodium gonderi]
MSSDTKSEDEYFDFNGIFPECTDGFDWDTGAFRGRGDANKFTTLCSGLNLKLTTENRSTEFSELCRVLGLYLKHIETNKNEHAQRCCKLFYYNLKKDIIDNFTLKYTGSENCYRIMTEYRRDNLDTQISSICLDHFVNIGNDTFKIMKNLFEIYKYINLFETQPIQRTTTNMHKFKSSIEKLETHLYKYKNQLKLELEKIIKRCEGYKKNWKTVLTGVHASYHLYDKWIEERRIKINEENAGAKKSNEGHGETLKTNVLRPKVLMHTGVDVETHTGISVGMIFITFSLLIIMFILYKYTPHFSFLKPRVRKLRRVLKKNNKKNLGLMDTFDFEYKNSLDDMYKIAYS